MADPEFTDTARAALLWVLWHHQGGSSPTGQAVRFALGMGQFDRLTPDQVAQAKAWAPGIPGLAHTDPAGVAIPPASGWRRMSEAPRDGTPMLLKQCEGGPLRHPFVGRYYTGSDDWGFAAPVGYGGIPDVTLEGWMPLPAAGVAPCELCGGTGRYGDGANDGSGRWIECPNGPHGVKVCAACAGTITAGKCGTCGRVNGPTHDEVAPGVTVAGHQTFCGDTPLGDK